MVEYPNIDNVDQLLEATCSIIFNCQRDEDDDVEHHDPPEICAAVLSLCHYFDCTRLLARAEHNCLLVVREAHRGVDRSSWGRWESTWHCFLLALRFGLQRVRTECIDQLAYYDVCCWDNHAEEWDSIRAQLDKDTLFELFQAVLENAAEQKMHWSG